ncbi:MAG TPA: EamA family transporter, partial [Ktedonobacteraceae bacterium]
MTRKGWLLFISMSVIWGIPYLFIKIAVQELDPSVVVFARVGIAAAVLLPVAASQGVLRKVRERWLTVAALACVQIVGPFLLISYTEARTALTLRVLAGLTTEEIARAFLLPEP